MTEPTVEQLIAMLGLQPHPEGGYYKETYRAAGKFGERNFSTAIYYMLPAGAQSKLHRLKSDELFHFYLGGSMTLVKIPPSGVPEYVSIGADIVKGQQLQHMIPAGTWFGSWCDPGAAFSMIGCTVSPGFDFADFEFGDRAKLLAQFPKAKEPNERLMP